MSATKLGNAHTVCDIGHPYASPGTLVECDECHAIWLCDERKNGGAHWLRVTKRRDVKRLRARLAGRVEVSQTHQTGDTK